MFDNIAISTNLSTLISKIIVGKLNSCVKMVFKGCFVMMSLSKKRSFLFFSNFELNKSRNYFKVRVVYSKDDPENF